MGETGRRRRRLLAGLLVTSVVASACGRSNDPDLAATPSPVSTSPSTSVSPEATSAPTTGSATDPTSDDRPRLGGLQLCDDVPAIEGKVIGSNVGGESVDPIINRVTAAYAKDHRDTYAGRWIDLDAGGVAVLAFTDDPETHRRALAAGMLGEWDHEFDVVQVAYSEGELVAAQDLVRRWMRPGGMPSIEGTGLDPSRNRVTIYLVEPSESEISTLARELAADQVCLEGGPAPADRHRAGDELSVIVPRGPDGEVPGDTVVSCGHPTFPLSALDSLTHVSEIGEPGLERALQGFLASGEGRYWPQEGWDVLTRSDYAIELLHVGRGDGVSFMSFAATRAGWEWNGSSGPSPCPLRTVLPVDLSEVRWRLDPNLDPPAPGDTEVHLLVTERECASGRPMGDRLLGPEVVETDDAVLIAFAAIVQFTGQDCQGNPSTAVTVTPPSPVADRDLRDGLLVGVDIEDHLD